MHVKNLLETAED